MMDGGPAETPRHATVMEAVEAAAATAKGLFFSDARDQDTPLPYAEMLRRARVTGGHPAGLGVKPGERVAMVLPTSPGFMDAFFGTLAAGAVPVPLYPTWSVSAEWRSTTSAPPACSRSRALASCSPMVGSDASSARRWSAPISRLGATPSRTSRARPPPHCRRRASPLTWR